MPSVNCVCCDDQFEDNNDCDFCDRCTKVFFESKKTARDRTHKARKEWLAQIFTENSDFLREKIKEKMGQLIPVLISKAFDSKVILQSFSMSRKNTELPIYTTDSEKQPDFEAYCYTAAWIIRNYSPQLPTLNIVKRYFDAVIQTLVVDCGIPADNLALQVVYGAQITALVQRGYFSEALQLFNQYFPHSVPKLSYKNMTLAKAFEEATAVPRKIEIDLHGLGYGPAVIATIQFILDYVEGKYEANTLDAVVFIVGRHGQDVLKNAVKNVLNCFGFLYAVDSNNDGQIHLIINDDNISRLRAIEAEQDKLTADIAQRRTIRLVPSNVQDFSDDDEIQTQNVTFTSDQQLAHQLAFSSEMSDRFSSEFVGESELYFHASGTAQAAFAGDDQSDDQDVSINQDVSISSGTYKEHEQLAFYSAAKKCRKSAEKAMLSWIGGLYSDHLNFKERLDDFQDMMNTIKLNYEGAHKQLLLDQTNGRAYISDLNQKRDHFDESLQK